MTWNVLILFALVSLGMSAAEPALETLKDLGHWKKVRAQVANAGSPESPVTLCWRSQVELAFGHPKEAYDLARKAAKLDQGNADIQCALGQAATALINTVNPIRKILLARESRQACEAALARNPRHVEALQFLAGFYTQAPGFVGGDPKRAEVLSRNLSSFDPMRGFLFEASMAQDRKDTGKAEVFYLKAIAANPDSGWAQSALAEFYLDPALNKPQEALKYARNAIRLEPGRAKGYTVLAGACASLERWEELDAVLAQAEQAVPDNLGPYYVAGRTLFLKWKDFPRVERYFRKYLTQEAEAGAPPVAGAHWRLGLVLEKLNRKGEAIAELEIAVRLAPEFEAFKKDLMRLK